jgi:hypothetical protein
MLMLHATRKDCGSTLQNEASKTRALDIAFVVTPDLLKRLAVILEETSYALEYTVSFSNGTTVRYDNIDRVIEQPNSDERQIVSLIAGTADETVKSAYVNLKKNDSPSLEYTISGTQRDVIYLANQLDDWVAAARQWYSPFFSGASGPSVFGFVLFAALLFLPLYVWAHIARLSAQLGNGGSYQLLAVPAMFGMWATEYWILKIFPRGIFAVGQGEKRHQFFIYVRRSVILGTAISVLVRILWVWFASRS